MCELLSEHTILIPSDEGIDFDPDETGTTFYENSLIKARTLYDIVHCPVIADDSGICVDALGGAPGIFSSRYAGPDFMHGKPDGTKIPAVGSPTLSNQALCRFPSVKLGPGDSPRSHTADEYVMVDDFAKAVEIYVNLLDNLTV